MTDQARGPVSLDAIDLGALLSSRICHDVVNPVGAIINGLELLDDKPDAETTEMALDLIRKSAKQAAARIQFFRIAFGAGGSVGATVDTRDAYNVAKGFLTDDRTTLDWAIPPAFLPKNRVKLLLNMLVIAQQAIPRGGRIAVEAIGDGEGMGFRVSSTGINVRLLAHAAELLAGVPVNEQGTIDAHSIQPYFTGLLARACGMSVHAILDGDTVVVTATWLS